MASISGIYTDSPANSRAYIQPAGASGPIIMIADPTGSAPYSDAAANAAYGMLSTTVYGMPITVDGVITTDANGFSMVHLL